MHGMSLCQSATFVARCNLYCAWGYEEYVTVTVGDSSSWTFGTAHGDTPGVKQKKPYLDYDFTNK